MGVESAANRLRGVALRRSAPLPRHPYQRPRSRWRRTANRMWYLRHMGQRANGSNCVTPVQLVPRCIHSFPGLLPQGVPGRLGRPRRRRGVQPAGLRVRHCRTGRDGRRQHAARAAAHAHLAGRGGVQRPRAAAEHVRHGPAAGAERLQPPRGRWCAVLGRGA